MATKSKGQPDEVALRKFFEARARYMKEMPGGPKYCLRVPGMPMALISEDTHNLWAQLLQYAKENPMNNTWKAAPTECANKDCQRDLRKVNPTYSIRDREEVFCSRECRATITKEEIRVISKPPESEPKPESPKAVKQASAKAPATPKPPAQPKGPKGPGRSATAPWSNLAGKLVLTGKQPPNFQGNRKQVWDLIVAGQKKGITVGQLYEQCDKLCIDGKANLAKIVGHYACAEVK